MPSFRNIATQRFGRLIAIAPIGLNTRRAWQWVTVCDCGAVTTVGSASLRSRNTKSCGCLQQDIRIKHGKSRTPVYDAYVAIRQRCINPKDKGFPHYGGRGITCEFTSFEEFYAEVGDPPGPGYSIDRIKNNLSYQKGNLRWATQTVQNNNKRSNHHLTLNGQTLNVTEWAKQTGISRVTLFSRLRAGWSDIRTLTDPVQSKRKYE